MAKNREVYKCSVCGQMVEILDGKAPSVVCCGKPMEHMKELTVEGAVEKHVPVIEQLDNGVRVVVGEVHHPMVEAHSIQWIELITENGVYRKELCAGEKPAAEFYTCEEVLYARAYCNLHGLWRSV